MNSKSSIDIQPHLFSAGTAAKNSYDFAHSDVIKSLSYSDIIGHLGSKEDAIARYKEMIAADLPRSASFLMQKIIKGSLAVNGNAAVKKILLDDLSRLTDNQMATDADTIISKITKPTKKKKILFCSGHWLTGGMERVMSTLFRELENDYEIFLITPYDNRESCIDVPDFITSIKIADELFAKHFDSLILSYALLLDIDVVIGYMNIFEKQLNFYNLCVGTKIKTIASNHEYYFYPYKSPPHYEVVEKRLNAFGKCDAIVWPNNFSAALCGMYVSNNYVIGNPNNFEVAQKISPQKANVIICVGRFNDYVKRIDRILECFSLVLKKIPDARLMLVGKYDSNAPIRQDDPTTVNDLIHKFAIPRGSLSFVGEVDNMHDYYAKAKVLLLTSNSEGFGMVLNEAACFGVPSVCNYIPGVEDIIIDGESGFITEQDDIGSMAARVCDVLIDNELRERLSKNAKKKVEAYDSRHIGGKWRYLINTLVEVKDHEDRRKRLSGKLRYKIQSQQLLLRVLSRELNEIFYRAIENGGNHRAANGTTLILSKIKRLPARLRANAEYEGWLKTGNKVVTRSYRAARRVLKT
jgi:glycosyltransferase involved in cell wall biosynthesis